MSSYELDLEDYRKIIDISQTGKIILDFDEIEEIVGGSVKSINGKLIEEKCPLKLASNITWEERFMQKEIKASKSGEV